VVISSLENGLSDTWIAKSFAVRAPKDLGLRPPGSGDPFSNVHPVTLEAASPPSVARIGAPGALNASRRRKAVKKRFVFVFYAGGPGPQKWRAG